MGSKTAIYTKIEACAYILLWIAPERERPADHVLNRHWWTIRLSYNGWGLRVPSNTSVWQPSIGGWFGGWLIKAREHLLDPSQWSRPVAHNRSFWERVWGFPPYLRNGVAGSIPGKTKYERALNVPGHLSMVSQINLSSLKQSWMHDSHWCVMNQVYSCIWEYRTPLRGDLSFGPVDAAPFHWHSHRGAISKLYIPSH